MTFSRQVKVLKSHLCVCARCFMLINCRLSPLTRGDQSSMWVNAKDLALMMISSSACESFLKVIILIRPTARAHSQLLMKCFVFKMLRHHRQQWFSYSNGGNKSKERWVIMKVIFTVCTGGFMVDRSCDWSWLEVLNATIYSPTPRFAPVQSPSGKMSFPSAVSLK